MLLGMISLTFRQQNRMNSLSLLQISYFLGDICWSRMVDWYFSCPPWPTIIMKLTSTQCYVTEWRWLQIHYRTLDRGGEEWVSYTPCSLTTLFYLDAKLVTIKKLTTAKYPPPSFTVRDSTVSEHVPAHRDFREKYFQGFKKDVWRETPLCARCVRQIHNNNKTNVTPK